VEGEATPMMMEKDLPGNQTRVGKEDRTGDSHPSEKKRATTSRTMNS